MSYMVDKPPSEDKLMQRNQRVWEPEEHRPNLTASKSGYRPYSTYGQQRHSSTSLETKTNALQDEEQVRGVAARSDIEMTVYALTGGVRYSRMRTSFGVVTNRVDVHCTYFEQSFTENFHTPVNLPGYC